MTIRSITCPSGPHGLARLPSGTIRPVLASCIRQALIIDWFPITPVDEAQLSEQEDRWESLSTIAFKAVLDVANEALAAGDLEGGAHALMTLVGGVYFGGGDVGHAIWIAHGLEEHIWGELIPDIRNALF